MRLESFRLPVMLIACGLAGAAAAASVQGSRDIALFDTIIRHARVVDGTGNPWYRADVGLEKGRIAAIGDLSGARGRSEVDLHDLVLAPGFIDLMGTSSWELLADPRAASKLEQGITLMVAGEGESVAPRNGKPFPEEQRRLDRYHVNADWRTLGEFFGRLERNRIAINFGTFVGTGTLRELVVGSVDRSATPTELAQMKELTAQAMRDGAFGVASALMYVPGRFASTEELIALASVARSYGGIYATHQRSEGDAIDTSMDEVFAIAKQADIPVHIFHLKTMYRENWGRMAVQVERIAAARSAGIDVTASVYPYEAASANFGALMPPWAQEGGVEKMLQRLADPADRARIRNELATPSSAWENEYYGAGGAEGFLIVGVVNPELEGYVGSRLSQIAREQGKDPRDTLMDLVIADRGATSFVSFIMREGDVDLAVRQPWSAFCTDAEIGAVDGPIARTQAHPRAFGALPRVFGHYVRDQGALSLEDAVRKASSLPAQIIGLQDRGRLVVGYWADLVAFDPALIAERATYRDPVQYPKGITDVWVNGELVVDHESITEARPGKVIRGPGYRH